MTPVTRLEATLIYDCDDLTRVIVIDTRHDCFCSIPLASEQAMQVSHHGTTTPRATSSDKHMPFTYTTLLGQSFVRKLTPDLSNTQGPKEKDHENSARQHQGHCVCPQLDLDTNLCVFGIIKQMLLSVMAFLMVTLLQSDRVNYPIKIFTYYYCDPLSLKQSWHGLFPETWNYNPPTVF